MKINFKSRSWHQWSGLLLALPILLVAMTALVIAHRKTLGTEEIKVAAGWLPGYQLSGVNAGRNEARSSLLTAQGETLVGTFGGLYRLSDEQLVAIEALGETQIRGLAEAPWGRIAAARNGVWMETGGHWQRVVKGDASSASSQSDGSIVVAIKDKGLLISRDGLHWQTDSRLAAALTRLPDDAESITLTRLVFDLHSGRAFLGKDREWLWIDLIGLSLSLLALTGVYMWWRTRRRKASRRLTQSAMSPDREATQTAAREERMASARSGG